MRTHTLSTRSRALAYLLLLGVPQAQQIARTGVVTRASAEAAYEHLRFLAVHQHHDPTVVRAVNTLTLAISLAEPTSDLADYAA